MFGIFKNKPRAPLSGEALAMKGLENISTAIAQRLITLEQGRVFDDVYVHADSPEGKARVSYVMFSPTVRNEVVARCAIVLDRVQGGISIWQVDWAVAEKYRNDGFGTSIAVKSIEEFKRGMAGKLKGGLCLEAAVDQDNIPSNKIAAKVLGNCESGVDPATGKRMNSYLLQVRG